MSAILDCFDAWWRRVRRWFTALWIARASLISVLAGFGLFGLAGAVHDILRGLAQDLAEDGRYEGPDVYRLAAFFLGAFLWAAAVHYWARILLWLDLGLLPDDPVERDRYRDAFKRVPRWLGKAALLAVAIGVIAAWRSSGLRAAQPTEHIGFVVLLVGLGVELLLFHYYCVRRIDGLRWADDLVKAAGANLAAAGAKLAAAMNLMKKDASPHPSPKKAASQQWQIFDWLEINQWRSPAGLEDVQPLYVRSAAGNRNRIVQTVPLSGVPEKDRKKSRNRLIVTLAFLLVVGLGVMIWAMVDALLLGRFASQSGILFLILTTWLPFFSVLVFLDHWRRFPILVPLALVALAAQILPGDVHALRLLPPERATGSNRPTLETALAAWTQANPAANATPVPLVIVATAGGGSRAAYWTATVLGAIQDFEPNFRNRLFAVSAVSGGALGAATFAALLRHEDNPGGALFCRDSYELEVPRTPINKEGRFQRCGHAVTSGDFLGPPFAALGYQDAIYWALPIPLAADRAAVIEQAWERAWRRTAERDLDDRDGLLAKPFASFGPSAAGAWQPALLFNGTSVGTGKRIVASHLDFAIPAGNPPRLALDAFDLFALHADAAQRMALSTAVTVAARFPYVLPAGTLRDGTACPANGEVCDRVVDGGYFENFGAATAEDLLLAMQATLGVDKAPWARAGGPRIQPIIVQISSDPELDAEDPSPKTPATSDARWWAEIVAPPESLYNTQSARGVLAMQALKRRARQLDIPFIHFSLHEDGDKGKTMPLSWALSRGAQYAIRRRLCSKHNSAEMAKLADAMDSAKLRTPIKCT